NCGFFCRLRPSFARQKVSNVTLIFAKTQLKLKLGSVRLPTDPARKLRVLGFLLELVKPGHAANLRQIATSLQ
ncbi:MAG TPA: hypothetical protein VH234_00280, partial [Candidatus Saccharimonadales bacterium]|nr:hypothetical protein [Candidatus Saccharimonadales bacterium]